MYFLAFRSIVDDWYASNSSPNSPPPSQSETTFISEMSELLSIVSMTLPAIEEAGPASNSANSESSSKSSTPESTEDAPSTDTAPPPPEALAAAASALKAAAEASKKDTSAEEPDDTPLLPVLYYRILSERIAALGGKGKGKGAEASDLESWGSEYLRSLSFQIGVKYGEIQIAGNDNINDNINDNDMNDDTPTPNPNPTPTPTNSKKSLDMTLPELYDLVDIIVPYLLRQGPASGIEAVDLLCEVAAIDRLSTYMDALSSAAVAATASNSSYDRVADYVVKTSNFEADPIDRDAMLTAAGKLYQREGSHIMGLRILLVREWNGAVPKEEMAEKLNELFEAAAVKDKDKDNNNNNNSDSTRKQMAIILGRHRCSYEFEETSAMTEELAEELNSLIGNENLSEMFVNLGRELDVVDAKTPEVSDRAK